jgi:Putative transposase of IS4/5 family (DUF4096)
MSESGHSLQGRPSGKFSHVRCDAESGSQLRTLAATLRALRVDDPVVGVILALKPEPRIMGYEPQRFEWTAINPMLTNKPRGVRRVNDRRVVNGIFGLLRSGAPWRDQPSYQRGIDREGGAGRIGML